MSVFIFIIYVGLGAEGQFEAAGGVALIAGQALQAAVVVQVAGAGGAHTVQLSMGELSALYVHLDLLLVGVGAVGALGAEGGAHAVGAYPLPLPVSTAPPQEVQLPAKVPLLPLQILQLILRLPISVLQFLYMCFGFVEQAQCSVAVAVWSEWDERLQSLQTQTEVSSPILLQLVVCGPVVSAAAAVLFISEFPLSLVGRALNRRKRRGISVLTLSFSPL